MQMRKLVIVLIASAAIAGCTSTSSGIPDEQIVMISSAVSLALEDHPPERRVAICLPNRIDADAKFNAAMGSNAPRTADCPYWRNKLLRKSQWELEVASISVVDTKSVIEIMAVDPSGNHAGRYLIEFERGPDGWNLVRKLFGVA